MSRRTRPLAQTCSACHSLRGQYSRVPCDDPSDCGSIETSLPTSGRPSWSSLRPCSTWGTTACSGSGSPNDEAAASAARARASQLSGPAARVGERHRAWVAYTPPAITGGPTIRLSPIASWFVAFDANNPVEIGPQAVLDYADQLAGRLDHEYRETLARERTLAGRVARFVTWEAIPSERREGLRRTAAHPNDPPPLTCVHLSLRWLRFGVPLQLPHAMPLTTAAVRTGRQDWGSWWSQPR